MDTGTDRRIVEFQSIVYGKGSIKYGKTTMNFRKFRFLKFEHVGSRFLVIKTLKRFLV